VKYETASAGLVTEAVSQSQQQRRPYLTVPSSYPTRKHDDDDVRPQHSRPPSCLPGVRQTSSAVVLSSGRLKWSRFPGGRLQQLIQVLFAHWLSRVMIHDGTSAAIQTRRCSSNSVLTAGSTKETYMYKPGLAAAGKILLAAGFNRLKPAGKKSWWQQVATTKMSFTYDDNILNWYPLVVHKLYTF